MARDGYVATVAVSLKASAATVAALFALFCGVEVAHAGGLEDVIGDTSSAAESALPGTEETGLGGLLDDTDGAADDAAGAAGDLTDAVDDATDAVDDALDGAEETVDDAKGDAEGAVSDVKGTVDDALADPKGAVEDAIQQVSGTVDDAVGTVDGIVDSSPVADIVRDVTNLVDPVASTVGQSAIAGTKPASLLAATSELAPTPSQAAARGLTPRSWTVPGSAQEAPSAATGEWTPRSNPDAILSTSRRNAGPALSTRDGWPLTSAVWTRPPALAGGTASDKASSAAPAAPFGRSLPAELPMAAALMAGAAGAALTAALLCAFLLLAPRTGRLARPGPILVRPEPCLSLPERPG